MNNLIEKYIGEADQVIEGDARGGGIKIGMSGKTKEGKKIKVLKRLGKKYSEGFLVVIDGKESEMHPGEMNQIRWK